MRLVQATDLPRLVEPSFEDSAPVLTLGNERFSVEHYRTNAEVIAYANVEKNKPSVSNEK